ncbi:SDR family NAD(P)-dependent oxidoreductase [Dyadobacter sp. MSC1_007]|jgi:NAD(P)-dependent dehydrogenase (short-subunit alcohol dehydrogenase family)|uniref:SDR family NAD(P)-dependent oxidoreductase n=1 Tax=Dyadobacter sp. MSC1_007 TaxID=2909264 RepID=UPI00202F7E33|nr:SDR family NAD(P)-dependent oxidoreductase [Dyadobacter sp. MSC1_007]
MLVRDEIIQLTGNPHIEILIADLLLMKEVKRMAGEFKERHDKLDVLINNAGGLMGKQIEFTPEQVEKTFAVNVLAPFLLSNLLLEALKKSSGGRIVNVSSNSHQLNASPDFSDLQIQNSYNPLKAYGNAKLFLIWNSQTLAKNLYQANDCNVTVNTMHPGAVRTDFGANSDLGFFLNMVGKIARRFFKTAQQGADTLVYLATSEKLSQVSGKYFVNRKEASVATKYYSPERAQQIWTYCGQLCEKLIKQ